MNAALSTTTIDAKLGELQTALRNAEASLGAAQRLVARVHLGDGGNLLAAAEAHAKIYDLTDAIAGLEQLRLVAQHQELTAEIKRRKTAHEEAGRTLDRLKAAVDEGRRPIEGAGHAWRQRVRESSDTQNERFERFAAANVACNADASAIAELEARLRELDAGGIPT